MRVTLNKEAHKTDHSAKDHHRMKPDESATEEVLQREAARPTAVIGITNDETGKQEEEVNRQIAMIEVNDGTVPYPIHGSREGIAFKDVMEHDEQGGNATQTVKQFIVGFGIGKAKCRYLVVSRCMSHDYVFP